MLPETVFTTPYLRYNNAADLIKIQAQIQALGRESARINMLNQPRAFSSVQIDKAILAALEPNSFSASATAEATSVQSKRLDSSKATAAPALLKRSLAGMVASPLKVAADASVTPNGTVLLGFNCRRTFQASAPLAMEVTHAVWNLLMKNQQSGQYEQIFFMGGISALTKKSDAGRIKFDHDFSSYRDAAYASPNKTAQFVVEVRPYCLFDELAPGKTDPVTLDFSPTSCIGIHSVALSRDSVTGGDNQSEPTLTVPLDAPAGPGGQKVALSVDNSNLGNIMGSGWFMIPQGQTSGQISWFLGTRQVYSTGKTITIKAQLVSPGGNSGPAYATVKLTKK